MKNNIIHINNLLEKYFEGTTTLPEEKMLREYFQQKNIDSSLEIYRPIFGFFSEEIKIQSDASRKRKNILIRWIGIGIAASATLLIGIKLFDISDTIQTHSVVYISGKAYTNDMMIREETLKSIENISAPNPDLISSQIEILDSFIN